MAAGGPAAVAQARRQLARVDLVNIDSVLLDEAATLAPGTVLRSVDAIHLASAGSIGADLRAVITYDLRMADAAAALSLVVEAPA